MNQEYLQEEMKRYNQDRLMEVEEVSDKILSVINSNTPSGSIPCVCSATPTLGAPSSVSGGNARHPTAETLRSADADDVPAL